jgi:hypothetical protein
MLSRKEFLDWSWRAAACVLLSVLPLDHLEYAEFWVPGVAFSLLIITGRAGFRWPLLISVSLAYTLAMIVFLALGNLDAAGLEIFSWKGTRTAVAVLGPLGLALSLRFFGGFSWPKALVQLVAGTALVVPFAYILADVDDDFQIYISYWIMLFAVWQMPMSLLYYVQTKKG